MKKFRILTVVIVLLFTVLAFFGCNTPDNLTVTLEGGEGITFEWFGEDERVPDTEYFNVWLVKHDNEPVAILEGVDNSLKQTKGQKEQSLEFTAILLYGYSDEEAPTFTVRVGDTVIEPKAVEKRSFYWSGDYMAENTPAWEQCWHYSFEQGGYLTNVTLEMFKNFQAE